MSSIESGHKFKTFRLGVATGFVLTAAAAVGVKTLGPSAVSLAEKGADKIERFYNPESIVVSEWQNQVKAKLDGEKPLSPGEKIINEVKVAPAGQTYGELLQMKAGAVPVNVRNFPSTYFNNGDNTEIIGRIPQGTIIKHILVVQGVEPLSPNEGAWIAFRLGSVEGPIFNQEGKKIQENPDTIGFIYFIYANELSEK